MLKIVDSQPPFGISFNQSLALRKGEEGVAAQMPPILVGEEDQKGPWKRYSLRNAWLISKEASEIMSFAFAHDRVEAVLSAERMADQ